MLGLRPGEKPPKRPRHLTHNEKLRRAATRAKTEAVLEPIRVPVGKKGRRRAAERAPVLTPKEFHEKRVSGSYPRYLEHVAHRRGTTPKALELYAPERGPKLKKGLHATLGAGTTRAAHGHGTQPVRFGRPSPGMTAAGRRAQEHPLGVGDVLHTAEGFLEKTLPSFGGKATSALSGVDAAMFAGLPKSFTRGAERAAGQIATGFLGLPGAAVMTAQHPLKVAKAIPRQIAQDFAHPGRNPGYLALDLLGIAGGVEGALGRAGAVRAAEGAGGKALAALRRPDYGSREIAPGVFRTRTRPPSLLERAVEGGKRARTREGLLPAEDMRTVTAPDSTVSAAGRLGRTVTRAKEGAARRRQREVEGALRSSRGIGLLAKAKDLTGAEGLTIHLVAKQVTPKEAISGWQRELKTTSDRYYRQTLQRGIQVANEVHGKGLVTVEQGEHGHPVVDINPAHEKLAAIERETAASSERQQAVKVGVGELEPETARIRINTPGGHIRGEELVPGEDYHLVTPGHPSGPEFAPSVATVESLERDVAGSERRLERLQAALAKAKPTTVRGAQQRIARIDTELAPVYERLEEDAGNVFGSGAERSVEQARRNRYGSKRAKLARPTVTEEERLHVQRQLARLRALEPRDSGLRRVVDLLRQRDELAAYVDAETTGKAGREFFGEGPAVAPNPRARALEQEIADEERIRAGRTQNATEAAGYLPRPVPLRRGRYYIPGYHELRQGGQPARLAHRGAIGIPRRAVRRGYEGVSDRYATFDFNAPRAVAQSELGMHTHAMRLDAWQTAKEQGITAQQLIHRLEEGTLSPDELARNWRAVRMQPGASTAATKAVQAELDRLARHGGDPLIGRLSGLRDVSGHQAENELRRLVALANKADLDRQLRFVDATRLGFRHLELRPPDNRVMRAVKFVNQAAKGSLLFSKLSGYALPQVIGQVGMSVIGMGFAGSLEGAARAASQWRKLSPDAHAMISAGSGSHQGIAHALEPGRGPSAGLRRLNTTAANAYGKVIDSPFRTASWFYHAAEKGITTPAEIERLARSEPGSEGARTLQEIRDSVDEDFARFQQLGPAEQRVADFVFFYPWLRASTRYAARLPYEHPVKAAVIGQAGRYSEDQTRADLVRMLVQAGATPDQAAQGADLLMRRSPGILTLGGRVVTPQSVAFLEGPQDIANLLSSPGGEIPQALLSFGGTPAEDIAGAAINYDTFTGRSYPEGMSIGRRFAETAEGWSPYVTLGKRLTGNQGKTYTYTRGQAVAQTLLGSEAPRGLNTPYLADAAARAERAQMTPVQRVAADSKTIRQDYVRALTTLAQTHPDVAPDVVHGLMRGKLPPDLSSALTLDARRKAAQAQAEEAKGDTLTATERLHVDLRLMVKTGKITPKDMRDELDYDRGKTDAQVDGRRRSLINEFLGGDTRALYSRQIREAGIELSPTG